MGPLVLLLLALLLALIALHETSESVSGELGQLCIGIVLVLLTGVLTIVAHRVLTFAVTTTATRGPPHRPTTRFIPVPSGPDTLPLRL